MLRTEAVGLGPAELWGSNVRGQLGGREVLAETVGCWAEEDEQCLKKEKIWEEEQLPEHMTRRTQSDLSERECRGLKEAASGLEGRVGVG